LRTVEECRQGVPQEVRYVLEEVRRSLVAAAAGIGALGALPLGLQAATPALVVGQQLVATHVVVGVRLVRQQHSSLILIDPSTGQQLEGEKITISQSIL